MDEARCMSLNGSANGRFHLPIMPTNVNSLNALPPTPRMVSPQPSTRGSIASVDRLSLRLRSNSGLGLHTNEAAFKQYIDYGSSRSSRPKSYNPAGRTSTMDRRYQSAYDEVPELSPRSTAFTTSPLEAFPPSLDILSRDIFSMMLENQSTSQHFLNYCEDQGCEENIEFLMRVKDFTQSTDEVAAVLTQISTSFTAMGAARAINLPPLVNRALNTDLKRIARSVLPSVEGVFHEARSYIETRTAKDIFPGFVKSQFAYCTALALATSSHLLASVKLEYPGLGESFCMVDATDSDNSIVAASEAFARMTGYSLKEMVSRSCAFLQGPGTDQIVVAKIDAALRGEEETVELLLNYRKDGEAFWNLLFLMPLRDSTGRLRYWLGAQVNVSESVNSKKDVMRVLNWGKNPYADSGVSFGSPGTSHGGAYSTKDGRGDGDSVMRGRGGGGSGGGDRRKSRTPFMSTFRKGSTASTPSTPATATASHGSHYDFIPSQGSRQPRNGRFSSQLYKSSGGISIFPTAYSYYLVLSTAAAGSSQHRNLAVPRMPTPSGSRGSSKKQTLKMPVVFYSEAAADLLGLRSDVCQSGIFDVLSEHAGSPSMTKSFKATIRERVMFGKSTSAEILIDRAKTPSGRRSTVGGAGGGGARPVTADRDNGGGGGGGMTAAAAAEALDRLERKLAKSSRQQDRVMTHWTPLHDGGGCAEWVVLVLTPLS
ncbi:phototropin [Microdochium nivale]|nr:phototropin [Microdochium nivale]